MRLLVIENWPNAADERLLVRDGLREGVTGQVTTGKRPPVRGLGQDAMGKRPLVNDNPRLQLLCNRQV